MSIPVCRLHDIELQRFGDVATTLSALADNEQSSALRQKVRSLSLP